MHFGALFVACFVPGQLRLLTLIGDFHIMLLGGGVIVFAFTPPFQKSQVLTASTEILSGALNDQDLSIMH